MERHNNLISMNWFNEIREEHIFYCMFCHNSYVKKLMHTNKKNTWIGWLILKNIYNINKKWNSELHIWPFYVAHANHLSCDILMRNQNAEKIQCYIFCCNKSSVSTEILAPTTGGFMVQNMADGMTVDYFLLLATPK